MTAATQARTVIVLPTYNERDNVGLLLRHLRALLPEAALLVIDDSSPDGTAEIVAAVAAELGQIKLVQRPGKQGLGSAYRHGFQVALDEGYDVVVSMDVDFSHDPATIPTMLSLVDGGADAVIGSRYVPGGGTVDWPVYRRALSRWGNRYTAGVLRLSVRDCTSGFRAYRATALRAIEPATTTAEGYAFLTELVRRLGRAGFEIVETPITFVDRQRGVSKMSSRIIIESMLLVTRWGVRDAFARVRRRQDTASQVPGGSL